MSFFVSLGILILAILLQALLRLTPSVFTIFYHYALGKTSKTKAFDNSAYFICGVAVTTVLLLLSLYSLAFYFTIPSFILTIIFVILGIFSLLFYFRNGKSTELFLPRKAAKNLTLKAKTIKKKSDIFVLGALSGAGELFMSLPLFVVVTTIVSRLDNLFMPRGFFIVFYVLASILPLIIIRAVFHSGRNLAEIQRFRVSNKNFYRFVIGEFYLLIAFLLTFVGF